LSSAELGGAMIKKVIAAVVVMIAVASTGSASAQIQRQRAMNWCWAACIQEVLSRHGSYVSQEYIAARLMGWPQDAPARASQVAQLIQSFGLQAWEAGRPASAQELYSVISQGHVVVALIDPSGGAEGHFVVIEGMDPRNGLIMLADPASGNTAPVPIQAMYQWNWMDGVVSQ
jgi:ABC-type bacteriocin/lantibiotic exporter with double-glycine peptidase domain